MYKALIAIILVATFALPLKTEAAPSVTCASSPSASGKLTQDNGSIIGLTIFMPRGYYVTGICATVNGHTYTTTTTNQLLPVGTDGCYNFYKAPTYAFVSAGDSWSSSCPAVTLTVRKTGQVAAQH